MLSEPSVAGRRTMMVGHRENPYKWVPVTDNAGFSPRFAHAAGMNWKQEMIVLGGATSDGLGEGGYLNDVWESGDQGRSWHLVTPRSPRFSPRRGHTLTIDNE